MPNLDEVTFMKEMWKTNFKAIRKRFLQIREEKVKQNLYAEFFAKQAMTMYQNEDYKSAKNMYFLSLFSVEYGTALHGIILSNLSSVDYFLKDYENCIRNIEMCMTTQYAKTSFPKLYARKIKSLIHLNDKIKASHVFEEYLLFLEEHFPSKVHRDVLIEEAKKALTKTKTKNAQVHINCDELIIPAIEEGLSLTNKAKCAFSENMGTYIEASEVIKKGETILVEKFEKILHAKVDPTSTLYCITCVKKLEVLVPCENCGDVMYCSEFCKSKHLTEGHGYECSLFSSGFAIGLDPSIILAYRMLLKYITTNEICSKRWLDLTNECFFDTKEKRIYTLAISCCSVTMYMEENEDFMRNIKIFEPFQAASSSEDIKFIFAANLLKMAEFISRNRFINNREEKVYGFFPICSLFNHSCIPNTTHYTSGCTIVIKAEREIARGEQIFISYEGLSLTYWNFRTEQRRACLLEMYKFNCECEACENEIFNKDLSSLFQCKNCNSEVKIIKHTNNDAICSFCNYVDHEVGSNFIQLIHNTAESEENNYLCNIKLFQKINFNTKHILYFDVCRFIAIIALKVGKLEEAVEYIEIVQNMKLFYHFHNELNEFDELLDYLQVCLSVLLNKENQVSHINRNFLGKLKKLLEDLQMYVDLLCPTQKRFAKIDAVNKFLKIFEDICTLDKTITSCKWKSRNVNLY